MEVAAFILPLFPFFFILEQGLFWFIISVIAPAVIWRIFKPTITLVSNIPHVLDLFLFVFHLIYSCYLRALDSVSLGLALPDTLLRITPDRLDISFFIFRWIVDNPAVFLFLTLALALLTSIPGWAKNSRATNCFGWLALCGVYVFVSSRQYIAIVEFIPPILSYAILLITLELSLFATCIFVNQQQQSSKAITHENSSLNTANIDNAHDNPRPSLLTAILNAVRPYAPAVWPSVAVAFIVIMIQYLLVYMGRFDFIRDLAREQNIFITLPSLIEWLIFIVMTTSYFVVVGAFQAQRDHAYTPTFVVGLPTVCLVEIAIVGLMIYHDGQDHLPKMIPPLILIVVYLGLLNYNSKKYSVTFNKSVRGKSTYILASIVSLLVFAPSLHYTGNPAAGLPPKPPWSPRPESFIDVGEEHWAHEYIRELAKYGIVEGYPTADDKYTFRPDNSISRAEMTKIIAVSLKLPLWKYYSGSEFIDWHTVKDWARPYIGAAVAADIIEGSIEPDGLRINAEYHVTRQEMVLMAARAFDIERLNAESGFPVGITDFYTVDVSARQPFAFAINNELINSDGNKARPLENATRAEAAMILYKMLILKDLL